MWTLGKRNGENTLNVVVKGYDGQVLIHLRHYFKAAGEDRCYPTKKGVTLHLAEWDTFNQSFIDIDCEVRRLRYMNEQVESPPSKIIKIYLHSTFCGEDEWVHEEYSKAVYSLCNLHNFDQVYLYIHIYIYFSRFWMMKGQSWISMRMG